MVAMSPNSEMQPDNGTVEYTIELTGGVHAHESFREIVHEHDGEITSEETVDEDSSTVAEELDAALEYAQEAYNEGEMTETEAANEAAMDAIHGRPVTSEADVSVMDLLNELADMNTLVADDISEHINRFTWDSSSTEAFGKGALKALTYRSVEEYIFDNLDTE